MTQFLKFRIYHVAAAAAAATCVYIGFVLYKRFRKPRKVPAIIAFKLNMNIVSDSEECEPLIKELRRRSMEHNAIGFDCEWVTKGSKRKPVAMLQLSTYDGYCVLVRLNLLNSMPKSLIQLLEDISIYKVGVAPLNDANYLYQDHGLQAVGTLDLRHFAEMCGHSVGGLAHLSETLLGVVLNKSFKIRCGDWDAEILSPAQLHYAASDAHAAVRIFVKLVEELNKPAKRAAWCLPSCDDCLWDVLDDVCAKFADYNYKHININNQKELSSRKSQRKPKDPTRCRAYPILKRSKPLYDNCLLQAPDGELLSTCDSKKALWYVEKGLADLMGQEPLTVRLRFEPAGRSVGDVGKYYTLAKKNQCVVCGATDSYIRKNVVPREYRKYFPDIMKDHSSHDIVLLCTRCHQRSNMRDQVTREHLALQCRAPLPNNSAAKPTEDPTAKKARGAARALLQHKVGKYVVPAPRRAELEHHILEYYTDRERVTDELLQEASNLSVIIEKDQINMESHGEGVVKYFLKMEEKGLLRLEEVWRTNFLTSMRPQHMPELWSVSHNEDRLRVKWNEGRLSKEELQSIGVEEW